MKNSKLIIFGADDFAQMAKFYFDKDTDYKVCGFSVDQEYIKEDIFCGLPVIPSDELEKKCPKDEYSLFVAIAYTHLNEVREKKYNDMKTRGYNLATYVSSKATYWGEGNSIGDNCFIFEDNTIQPYAQIGSDTILWSGNHIGHHSKIGNHVFITSHVVLSGRTEVGDNSFIGVNATINDHVKIASKCVIGSGSLITRDTEPNSVYKNKRTEKYVREAGEMNYFFHSSNA